MFKCVSKYYVDDNSSSLSDHLENEQIVKS